MEILLCPYCWEQIEETTSDCPHCHLDVTKNAIIEVDEEEYAELRRVPCTHCQSMMAKLATHCPTCGKAK